MADVTQKAVELANEAQTLAERAAALAQEAAQSAATVVQTHGTETIVFSITVLVLAVFVGYHVVWRVTPALHSPLMSVTNAISSVIIVGALVAVGLGQTDFSRITGFLAVVLASVNIFGGFIVTQRMLAMFKKKQ
jgi:H+-translocating NAD(P) transhydrogenase subunit alpha